MTDTPYISASSDGRHHKRTQSAFRAIIPRSHKPDPATSPGKTENMLPPTRIITRPMPTLNPTHPDAYLPLAEVNQNRERTRSSPRKPVEVYDEGGRMAAVSKSPTKGQRKSKERLPKDTTKEAEEEKGPKKSKSSRSLSAFLSRPKSSRSLKLDGQHQLQGKDKENLTPPNSAGGIPTPIWAQFATQPLEKLGRTQPVPLNDRWDIQDEMTRYTPQQYSPSKGRNFYDEQPTLSKRPELKLRPKSAYLPTSISTSSFAETISGLRLPHRKQDRREPEVSHQQSRDMHSSRRSSTESRKVSGDDSQPGLVMAKRGSRVMAAVAALNGNKKESPPETAKPAPLDRKAIESAFEALLESRNIEQNVREKMRSLDTNIKANFIKQNDSGSASSADGVSLQLTGLSRPTPTHMPHAESNKTLAENKSDEVREIDSPKKLRPRSLTFTFSKGDQSGKKQRSDRPASHSRTKSATLVHSASSTSLNSSSTPLGHSIFNKTPKPSIPEDFVLYLRRVQTPQLVEIGKIQKLRQLLRNETVSWVDSFITKGGLAETIGLLYRIIEIEWREEHEDNLLHHTLMCLKAVFTTSLALIHLNEIEATLFPTLLRLLFSSGEEKKGPSEFATRGIIISLLFTYLSTSPPSETASRARTLLSYLRDPSKNEDERPVAFIEEIRKPRPYKVWGKEITDVTKEVFWIFLHHLNVVPYPPAPVPTASYATAHFPAARPPVPAAPYVGGVEWEATTYLATHLDLLNGILASLPTIEERNGLRVELKDSGLEKVMGVTLRTCKEKFYGGVHAGLQTWAGAAREDGWATSEVREGPKREEHKVKLRGSPKKKDLAPKLDVPKLDVGPKFDFDVGGDLEHEGWL